MTILISEFLPIPARPGTGLLLPLPFSNITLKPFPVCPRYFAIFSYQQILQTLQKFQGIMYPRS